MGAPEAKQEAPTAAPKRPAPARSKRATMLQRKAGGAKPIAAALVAYGAPDAEGVLYALRVGRNTVGRDDDQDVCVDDGRVSGRHGFLFVRPDGASYIDISTNGSVVDGESLVGEQAPLHEGSVIQVGHTLLVFGRLPLLPSNAWDGVEG
jgi:pSer/pThr/pTyr-binding forkhead associated (FHA) protein